MEKQNDIVHIEQKDIANLIYTVRGQKVMLDSDLAKIYGYETKRLNEQVKRNITKFPDDFMFELTNDEVQDLWSQNATANINAMSRSMPKVFTEQHWENDMKKQGYGMVLVPTQVDEEAQHFYRKLGYKNCGGFTIDVPGYEQPMEMFMSKALE